MTVYGVTLAEWRSSHWWPNGRAALILAGHPGHEREIVLSIEGYTHRDQIPDLVRAVLAALLPDGWKIENRGTRLELHPSGGFAGGYQPADVALVASAAEEIGLTVRYLDDKQEGGTTWAMT